MANDDEELAALRGIVAEIVGNLSDEQQLEVTRLYAETDMPIAEIAKRYGIPHSSVSRIATHHHALVRADSPSVPGSRKIDQVVPKPEPDTSVGMSSEIPRVVRGTRRVNVNFSDQAYKTLERLARDTGKSMSEVLRDSIALKSWFEQTRAAGGHVLVEHPDGKVREVISV